MCNDAYVAYDPVPIWKCHYIDKTILDVKSNLEENYLPNLNFYLCKHGIRL